MQANTFAKPNVASPISFSARKTSKAAAWASRIIRTLVVLFLLFDSITKLLRVQAVLTAAAQLGFSAREIVGIGIVLLVCVIVYVLPRTSVLGAILLTGYLGGATAIQSHAGNPIFETLFPLIFGVLVWAGIFLGDQEIRSLIPIRTLPAADLVFTQQ